MMPFWADSGNTDRVMGTDGRRGRLQHAFLCGNIDLPTIQTDLSTKYASKVRLPH
jgi:hypothetical protein